MGTQPRKAPASFSMPVPWPESVLEAMRYFPKYQGSIVNPLYVPAYDQQRYLDEIREWCKKNRESIPAWLYDPAVRKLSETLCGSRQDRESLERPPGQETGSV